MRFVVTGEHPSADDKHVLLEYPGSIKLRGGGLNHITYVGVVPVVTGRIILLREYSDPVILQNAFDDATAAALSPES